MTLFIGIESKNNQVVDYKIFCNSCGCLIMALEIKKKKHRKITDDGILEDKTQNWFRKKGYDKDFCKFCSKKCMKKKEIRVFKITIDEV